MPKSPAVAYFSAEYAVADDLPIYAGGLGILAADTVMQAGADGREFTALGMVYHSSFTGIDTDERPMTERFEANGFELMKDAAGVPVKVSVPIEDRRASLVVWRKAFGSAELLLLDARTDPNHLRDRAISDKLYAADAHLAFAQELALGFGGLALLRKLGKEVDIFHINEGHTAPAVLALAVEYARAHPGASFKEAFEAVRPKVRGTKHTILSAAGLFLGPDQLERMVGPLFTELGWTTTDLLVFAARENGDYSDTKLLIEASPKSSGVSKIHVAAEAEEHPGSPLVPLTNGIFAPRWRSDNLPPEPLTLPDEELRRLHDEEKEALLDFVAEQTETRLDPHVLTVVWARRMTAYKRPNLLVSDLERLGRIANDSKRPVQFIVAGQANPADDLGIRLMNEVLAASDHPPLRSRLAYLPGYNPQSARMLVRGADLWLNTPIRGMEACGTSGMKASLNGALQFSTSDGWIDEVNIEPIGWRLADENSEKALYGTLEDAIVPLYYDDRAGWTRKMRANIELIETQFTTERMLRDYYEQLYS